MYDIGDHYIVAVFHAPVATSHNANQWIKNEVHYPLCAHFNIINSKKMSIPPTCPAAQVLFCMAID